MPAVINVATNLMLGGATALVSRKSPAQRARWADWPLLLLLAFEAAIFTPTATYIFRFYPQWSLLYWFDPQVYTPLTRWVGWLSAAAVAGNFAAAIGGYVAARRAVIAKKSWLAAGPLLLGAAGLLTTLFLFGDRVAAIGDHDAFWHGRAAALFSCLPGWIALFLQLSTIAFVAIVYLCCRPRLGAKATAG